MTDFIEVYPDALDNDTCLAIIEQFEASGQAQPGRTGGGVDPSLKNSLDILIAGKPEWRQAAECLGYAAYTCLHEYVRKYPFLLIAPLALRYQDSAGQVAVVNQESFARLTEQQFQQMMNSLFRSGPVILQKFLAGQGGYPRWHSELYPLDPQNETLHRVLVYAIYLNDVPGGGETEFFHQQRKVAPKAGTLVLAPAGFTHTHRGNTPTGGDQYVATSWIMYHRAENLYRRQQQRRGGGLGVQGDP
jgi:hypothetical protein